MAGVRPVPIAVLVAALLVVSGAQPALAVAATDPSATDGEAPLSPSDPAATALPSPGGTNAPSIAAADAVASGPADAAAVRTTEGSGLAQQREPQHVHLTQEFRLTPERPGEVAVQLRYTVPDRVRSLGLDVPEAANVTDATGLRPGTETDYRWNGSTRHPRLTYTIPVNESANESEPGASAGAAVAVDAGDWALFQRPPTPTQWNYTGDRVELRRSTATAGPGAAGEWLVYLGPTEVHERAAHDQRFRLVVPEAASMRSDPDAVLDSLAGASDALRVGDRDEEVFVVAAPTEGVTWAVRGLQTGDADMWVRDDEPVGTADNVWVHEYVHTRQRFRLAPELTWFREATAAYYASLFTYEQKRVDFAAYRDRLARGAGSAYDGVVLSNRSTWTDYPEYDKGALVAGRLDREVRLATDRERTLQTVVRAVNDRSAETALTDFLTLLGETAGAELIASGQRYVATPSNASMWNESAQLTAYGQLPARIGYQLPSGGDAGAYRVSGPYRNETIAGADRISLVTGERLRVDASVRNAGGTTGEYELPLAVNGTVVDRANGTVAAGESRSVSLSHDFTAPGQYRVALGDDNVTVTVAEPAVASVEEVHVNRTSVEQGESVAVTALVRNTADRPAESTVVFSRDYEPVEVERVRVAPTSTATRSVAVPIRAAGTALVSVGGSRPIEIAVNGTGNETAVAGNRSSATPPPGAAEGTRTPLRRPGTGVVGSGFGLVAPLLAAVAFAALSVARRRY